jgi:uncharacterized protein
LIRREKPAAYFRANWTEDDDTFEARPGSLEFFLSERYCLYTESAGALYRCRIAHEPWPLRRAKLPSYETDLFKANDLPQQHEDPIAHAGGPVHVEVWPLEKIA